MQLESALAPLWGIDGAVPHLEHQDQWSAPHPPLQPPTLGRGRREILHGCEGHQKPSHRAHGQHSATPSMVLTGQGAWGLCHPPLLPPCLESCSRSGVGGYLPSCDILWRQSRGGRWGSLCAVRVGLHHLAVHGHSEGQAQDLHQRRAQPKDAHSQQVFLEPHLHCLITGRLPPGARRV